MIAEKCTKTSSPVCRWMKPYPFEALNHFTVPCSFDTAADLELELHCFSWYVSWATKRRTPRSPKRRDILQPAKKGRKVCPCSPLSESKGNTRATNAEPKHTTKTLFCPHRGERVTSGRRHRKMLKTLVLLVILRTRVVWKSANLLLDGFRLKGQIALAGRLFLPVFTHPRFPALARGGIAPGESQCRDFGIGNLDPLVGFAGQNAHKGAFEVGPGHAVKDITVDLASVFFGNGHVAAVIEGLLQSYAQIVFGGECRYPAFHAFVNGSGRDLKRFRVHFWIEGGVRRAVTVGVRRSAHARVSSSCVLLELICTSGLNAWTGFADSFSMANASESSYFPAKADLVAAQRPRTPLKV